MDIKYPSDLSRQLLILGIGLTLVSHAGAAEWDTRAAIEPSVEYTDNVCLSNNDKKDEFVGVLTPSAEIEGKGRKAEFKLGGNVRFNTLTNSKIRNSDCGARGLGDREQFAPSIRASGSAILVDDWLSLEAEGTADQNEVSSALASGDDFNRNGNTNTYYRYSVSPVLSRRLKDVATGTVRYTYDEVINSSDALSESTSNSVFASLAGGIDSQVSWNLNGSYRKMEYDDGLDGEPSDDTELRRVNLELGYQIDRQWQINGTIGQEFNDFETSGNDDTDGSVWDLGLRWTPSPRTTVSIGAGDRFFGTSPRAEISHVYKRSTFTGNYRKDITFDSDIRTSDNGQVPGFGNTSSLQSRSPLLDERVNLGYLYSGRYANFSVTGTYSEQQRAEDRDKSVFKNAAITYTPLFSRVYSLSGTLAWEENEPRGEFSQTAGTVSDTSETWRASIRLGRQLNQRANLSVSYQYVDRQSQQSIEEYQENRLTLGLNINL